jgi:glucosamine kinase
MTQEVLDHFHGLAGEIVDWTARATPADYAAFAPMVLGHAIHGEPNAELIVQESARRIEAIVRTMLERGVPHWCLMGGMASAMRDWLAPSIKEQLREPLGDSLDGAIHLARSRAGHKPG